MITKNHQKINKIKFALLFTFTTLLMFIPLLVKEELEQIESLGLTSIFVINLTSAATVFLPTPGIISVAVGGNIYPPLAVALLASLGSALGEGVGFLFGYSSKKIINQQKHKLLFHLLQALFKKYAKFLILIAAFIPNPLIDGLGILAGMASYSLKKYIFLVFIGRLLRNIIIAHSGYAFF